MNPDNEAFVKGLADRAKTENAFPKVTPPTNAGQQNAPPKVSISTKVGNLSLLGQEKNRLEDLAAREGKTGTDLIDQYLK